MKGEEQSCGAFVDFLIFCLSLRLICLLLFLDRVNPSTRHFDSLSPGFVHFLALYLRNVRGKRRAVGPVHVLEFRVVLPDVNGESSRNGRAESGSLVHRRTFHRHLANVGLGLCNKLATCTS